MNWYYVSKGQRVGPVQDEEFQSLVSSGLITPETLVWRSGMAQWQKYMEVAGHAPGATMTQAAAGVTAMQHRCAECGNIFGEDDMVSYSDKWVCAACKPIFFQRLKEGAPAAGVMVYGGFWMRFVAKFTDGIILSVVNYIIQFAFMFSMMPQQQSDESFPIVPFLLVYLLQIGVGVFYNTWFVGKFAATPGKMAMGLKIVTSDGGRVSYLRALARYFSEFLSAMILMMGYIMAGFDEQKRTLHDRICDTRVIKK